MSDYTDDETEIDQTNNVVDLGGDDGGADDAVDPDVDLADVVNVEALLDGDDQSGATAEDRDPAVGGYSEEGAP